MRIVEQSVELFLQNGPLTHVDANLILQHIERAGRLCYKSESKGDPGKFVRSLIDRGHESVIEHGVVSALVVTDRGISHEIVRHRISSYSQESTSYCIYSSDRFGGEITVIKPDFGTNAPDSQMWEEAVEQAEKSYLGLIGNGVSPQIARSVLPTCLKTELMMTTNLREWRHFLRLRMSVKAHPQMRVLAGQMLDVFLQYFPDVFGDLMKEAE